ncbi:MAG: hypothetical protein QOK28_1616 [Actinomycetota bacterium]|jgi:hypothetical protein
METKIGPILMGLAYLALVVFIIVFCATETKTFDDYAKYWGLFATLVGVATGAIPSFFFKAQADKAVERADKATERADKESTKAQVFAGAADPGRLDAVIATNPELFK